MGGLVNFLGSERISPSPSTPPPPKHTHTYTHTYTHTHTHTRGNPEFTFLFYLGTFFANKIIIPKNPFIMC